jgi:hypothetical protein
VQVMTRTPDRLASFGDGRFVAEWDVIQT